MYNMFSGGGFFFASPPAKPLLHVCWKTRNNVKRMRSSFVTLIRIKNLFIILLVYLKSMIITYLFSSECPNRAVSVLLINKFAMTNISFKVVYCYSKNHSLCLCFRIKI